MRKDLALAAALILALAFAWLTERTPAAAPLNAPAAQFSAARALIDDRVIARIPHPMGSPANAAARDYLLARMTALGLAPQIQRTDTFRVFARAPGPETYAAGGMVENIVGVLPGRDRQTPALVLMAHYDSVPGSPGAADDAAGVSSVLEIVRALKARGRPARDVIVLITDGEEGGLLGANAFFERHPLARRAGYLLNLETRGGGGRVQMFQTGGENGGDIALLGRAETKPQASSLSVFLYKRLPNDTDFTVSDAAKVPGLNYAFIGRQFDYHAPTSTPDNLDAGSLQDMGASALGAAGLAAFDPALPARAPDKAYSNLLGPAFLAYPAAAGWGVLAAAAGLLGLAVWRARRARTFLWIDLAQGLGATLYLLSSAIVFLRLARRATGAGPGFFEQRFLLAQAGRWEIALAVLSLGVLTYAAASLGRGRGRFATAALALLAGLACSAFGGWDPIGLGVGTLGAVIALLSFARPAGVAGAWSGHLVLALVAATALQILAPTVAFLIAWPLALACLLAASTGMGASRAPWAAPVLALGGALGAGWVLTYAHVVYLGLDQPEILALFVWLAALTLWPLAQAEGGEARPRTVALVLLAAGFALVALVRLDAPWSARHPRTSLVEYVVDADTGQARRVSLTPDLDNWTRALLTADGGKIAKADLPVVSARPVWSAPARPIPGTPAAVTLSERQGLVRLHATAPAGARVMNLLLRSDVPVADVRINGRPAALLAHAGQWTHLRWAASPDGVDVTFRPPGPGALEVRHAAVSEQWPQGAVPLPPRPADLSGFDLSDSTVVIGQRRFTWTGSGDRTAP
jgi:hypothetical protein